MCVLFAKFYYVLILSLSLFVNVSFVVTNARLRVTIILLRACYVLLRFAVFLLALTSFNVGRTTVTAADDELNE